MTARDAFFERIVQHTKQGEDIVIVSADLGAPSLDVFRRDFGNRFINVGIAEQNLLSVAGGLALAGKKVIAYGLNPFPVTRAYDQIRNIMSGLRIPITLTALNAGTCSAEAGYTHMPVENLAMLRPLKHIKIINPSDESAARKAADFSVYENTPLYIQFDKFVMGSIYDEDKIDFTKGFIGTGEGSDFTVITYGIWARKFIDVCGALGKNRIGLRVVDCFSLPVAEDDFREELKRAKRIVCIEDNCREGGLGSMVLEMLSDMELPKPVKRISLQANRKKREPILCNRDKLLENEGLDMDDIILKLKKWKGVTDS